MRKRIAALLLALVLCMGISVPALASSQQFTDVPASFWAYTEIMTAAQKGITGGYDDGTFKPGSNVTNAHFAAFLARAFYANEYTEGSESPWYKVYTDVLNEHGILDRTAVGNDFWLNINKPINRYDMAQMMRHILDDKNAEMPTNEEMAAARNAIGDWDGVPAEYRGAVSLCYAMGVLNGQSDGNFGGNNLMNRGQGCVVVYRLTQKIETGSTGIEPSVPEKPEEPEQPSTPSSGTQTLSNGKTVTEENVAALLEELKEKYPHNGYYDVSKSYYFAAMNANGHDCAKLAFMVSDDIFGTEATLYSHQNYESIKLGDIIEQKDENGNSVHWAVVNKFGVAPSGDRYVKTVSGGPTGEISWTYTYYLENMDNETIWSRYPNS